MPRPKKVAVAETKPKIKKAVKKKPEAVPEETAVAVYTENQNIVIQGHYSRQVIKDGRTIEFTIDWNDLAQHVKDAVPN